MVNAQQLINQRRQHITIPPLRLSPYCLLLAPLLPQGAAQPCDWARPQEADGERAVADQAAQASQNHTSTPITHSCFHLSRLPTRRHR
jgi:hypothetical protein